ncbi:DUF397 domain-containing protein [Streptomyces sp. NPDC015414]|uniref:DUF397 domain-containing protein n=1 Tax=Streptomyces sp. NPDC015414 TaxID=3364957 RepID=UPI0036F51313
MASNRIDLSDARWFKSSYSNEDGGNCLEAAAHIPGLIPVRDSKRPDGPALLIGAAAWAPFVDALKS